MIADKPGKACDFLKSEGGLSFLKSSPRLVRMGLGSIYYDVQAENVFEKEWDVLLILDACRPDAIERVANEYSFLPETVPTKISMAGNSPNWLTKTFTGEYRKHIQNTAYITANVHAERVLDTKTEGLYSELSDGEDWLEVLRDFVPVYKLSWDGDADTVLPRSVTDHLIKYFRETGGSRTIAHYMQPHFPSVPNDLGAGLEIKDEGRWKKNIWEELERGEIEVETAWEAYIENLRYVLDDIETVLDNLNADEVIITADHGNAFGEGGEWGHGQNYIEATRRVPWIKVEATDKGKYEPEIERNQVGTSVDEKLKALGYK